MLGAFYAGKRQIKIFDKKRLKEEKTIILECRHKYHETCLRFWMKTKNKCPLCEIKEKNKMDNNNEKHRLLKSDLNCCLNDYVNEIVYIQREAFPHLINEAQGIRIITNYRDEQKKKCEIENYFNISD